MSKLLVARIADQVFEAVVHVGGQAHRDLVADVEAEVQFDARYIPGLKVAIQSADVNGTFLIFKAEHDGDNFGGSFQSSLTLKPA